MRKKPVASSALRTMINSYRNTVNTDAHITKNLYFGGSGRKVLLFWGTYYQFRLSRLLIGFFILLHEKFLQFDWLRAAVFQLNLKYLHVKITNLLRVVV